jgi:hypothetical protein
LDLGISATSGCVASGFEPEPIIFTAKYPATRLHAAASSTTPFRRVGCNPTAWSSWPGSDIAAGAGVGAGAGVNGGLAGSGFGSFGVGREASAIGDGDNGFAGRSTAIGSILGPS